MPDPFGGREPTSHERMSGETWNASYHRDAPAPWDIGRPQAAVVRLAAAGGFTGDVLDAGCGSGENALHLATHGVRVVGVDVAETAIELARAKAAERGVTATFDVADAFALDGLGRTFDTALDCGLFHSLDTEERARYAASLASVIRHGGTVHVLCFGDVGDEIGPHPVTQDDLRAAFDASAGWDVVTITAERVETTFHEHGAAAWLATMRRR